MTTTQRRIALLTGASLATLGATPALAAPHDTLADGTYAGASTATDTVTICDLAATPGSPCFFGVIDTTPPSSAIVTGTANGQIVQASVGATVALSMTNAAGSSAEIGAIAKGGSAANASIAVAAISQSASASSASVTLKNDGNLLIDAVASATGDTAVAHARIATGIFQDATGSSAAFDHLTNTGDLTIEAHAHASGSLARASAYVSNGIEQDFGFETSGSGAANIDNSGTLHVGALATAVGSTAATAIAVVAHGIGFGNVTNEAGGTITIDAVANASASAALAEAVVGVGITEGFFNGTGDAVNTIANDGTISINAKANATGSAAEAVAVVGQGIFQSDNASGTSHNAIASVSNNGTLTIGATANASGSDFSLAQAVVGGGIEQHANASGASGNASAIIANGANGTINIEAAANAVGGTVAAGAVVQSAIFQSANASSGVASASVTNAGTIDIGAVAHATGDAEAQAVVEGGIGQFAFAGLATGYSSAALAVKPLATATGQM
jgi:hypothetical protein